MDAFWKWLMKANAKGVFVAALVVFLIVACICAWILLRPPADLKSAPPNTKRERIRNALGLMSYIDKRLADTNALPPINPFRNPGYMPPPPPPSTNTIVISPPTNTIIRPPTNTFSTTVKTPPPPPPPPEKIELTLKGTFKRIDGVAVAFIHDSKQNDTIEYRQGDTVFDHTVATITDESIDLVSKKGLTNNVPLFKSFTYTREARR